eukprot:GEMP01000417.1.p1 GENE.GEMP01000417.1~~GEMP01000417.1.p1  ORF type:complete len:1839 (+),score=427.70 GEMP01000417.1:92-5608(+)
MYMEEDVRLVCNFHKYLADYVQDVIQDEGAYKIEHIMRILECEFPSPSDLAFAIRTMDTYEEQNVELDIEIRGKICLRLWELFAGSTERYSYSLLTRIVERMHSFMHRLFEQWVPKKWMCAEQTIEPEIVSKIRGILDAKLVVDALTREMFASFRKDHGASESRRRGYMNVLAQFAMAVGRYQSTESRELMDSLLIPMVQESSYRHMLLWSRLLVLLLPRKLTKSVIASRELFDWWNLLPEGLVPKFDLLWFNLLARYAKISWYEGVDPKCQAIMQEWNPYLFNKISRVLSLPLIAPTTEATSSKVNPHGSDWPCDRFKISGEFDLVMGHVSTWKKVAKWIVYSLEVDTKGQMWTLLLKLAHVMRPFMIPINYSNEWVWHNVTLIHYLCQNYYQRVARERSFNATPKAPRLTERCDEVFVEMLAPMVHDGLHLKDPYEQFALLDAVSFLARLARPQVQWSKDASIENSVVKTIEALADPQQSERHASLLRLNARLSPVILRFYPSMLPDILSLVIDGIDATDPVKTFSSLAQVVCLFSNIPCLDINDLEDRGDFVPKEVRSRAWAANAPAVNESAVLMASSTLPGFAITFFEKILEFVPYISKPVKSKGPSSAMAGVDRLVTTLISVSTLLIASQVTEATAKELEERVTSWVTTSVYSDGKKTAKILVNSIARSIPSSIDALIPSLAKKILKGSEREVSWCLEMLGASVRHVGPALLKHRTILERIIRFCLSSPQKEKQKLGAKLIRCILITLTSTYIIDDFRCVPGKSFKTLSKKMGIHLWMCETWWVDHAPSVEWHVPSSEEIAWAEELAAVAVDDILFLFGGKAERGVSQPYAPHGVAEGAVVFDSMRALFLCKALMRGGVARWPDELGRRPKVSTQPGTDAIPDFFTSLGEALLKRVAECETEDDPKNTRKILRCLDELIHGRIPQTTGALFSSRTRRGSSGGDSVAIFMQFFGDRLLSQMSGATPCSKWCDLPRLWWVLRVADQQDTRVQERVQGYRFSGLRKELLLGAARLSTYSSFSQVRAKAQQVTSHGLRKHYGGRWRLAEGFVLSAFDKVNAELEAVTDTETVDPKLNTTITGLSFLICGALRGLMLTGWRRGAVKAARIVVKAMKTYFLATRQGNHVIRSKVATRLVSVFEAWLDAREPTMQTEDPFPPLFYSHLDIAANPSSDDLAVEENSPQETIEAIVRQCLDDYSKSNVDVNWRMKLVTTNVCFVLLHNSSDVDAWRCFLQWAIGCLEPVSHLPLQQMCTRAILIGLKRFPQLGKDLPFAEPDFVATIAKVLPLQFHRQADGRNELLWVLLDLIHVPMRERVWPRGWDRRSGAMFSLDNALWWQTYFRALRYDRAKLVECARSVAESLSEQSAAEQIYHVAFIEMIAGAIRAVRKEAKEYILDVWQSLYPFLVIELQGASPERLGDWKDGIRFILSGGTRLPGAHCGSKDAVFSLAYFLSSKFADVKAEVCEYVKYPADNGDSVSTFEKVKHIRLFKTLFSAPQCLAVINSEVQWTSMFEGVRPLLEHPFKQLRYEAAEACILLIRYQKLPSLRPAADLVLEWMRRTAVELAELLKKDALTDTDINAEQQKPPHVLKATGLTFCIIQALASRCREVDFLDQFFDFLVTASGHADTLVRNTAKSALALLSSSQRSMPEVPLKYFRGCTNHMQEIWSTLSTIAQERSLEATTSMMAANVFFLAEEDVQQLYEFSLSSGFAGMPDVRNIARKTFSSCLLLDNRPKAPIEWLATFPKHSTPYPLICVLYVGCDLGVPPWVGNCIEALVQYTSGEISSGVVKEVQAALQHFLRRQQASRILWTACQQKLSAHHLDLLNAHKGNLSYFS